MQPKKIHDIMRIDKEYYMRTLVGYTGFVGSNLVLPNRFDNCFNSKNIKDSYSLKPDILYYAGVPAQKYIANKDPERDISVIEDAMNNIEKIKPKSVVLISTVDVYKNPNGVDENTQIDLTELEPYGKHRYVLEQYIKNNYKDFTIIRLPGLYGKNIKKNFIYDMINFLPSMISASKIADLNFNLLRFYYLPLDNGFYQLREINKEERKILVKYFKDVGFSALSFTDSRSVFQFYNLKNLYEQIETTRSFGIRLLNVATEPCKASELYNFIYNAEFHNETTSQPYLYDMRTIHANTLGGMNGYIENRLQTMNEIKDFVLVMQKRLE